MKAFFALIQREILEYKNSFILTPILVGVLVIGIMVLSALSTEVHTGAETPFLDVRYLAKMPINIREWFLYSLMNDVTLILRVVLILVSINYLTGAFYNERKDGSDLFWRSLPINQWSQVSAKFVTVSMVVPAIYFAAIMVGQFCSLVLASYLSTGHNISITEHIWQSAHPLQTWGVSLSFIALDILWLAPVYCWLLLCSSFATRSPLLTALIPLMVIGIAESWVLDSHHVMKGIIWHSCPQELMMWIENLKHRLLPSELINLVSTPDESLIPNLKQWRETFYSQSLWIGTAIAAIFFIATVRVRVTHKES